MTKTLHILPTEKKEEDERIKISSIYEFPDGTKEEIWYKIPKENENELMDIADPFVIGSIFFGMALRNDIVVHGDVSYSLLQNLEEFQAIWQSWKPNDYKAVEISAKKEINKFQEIRNNDAIISFSGGVDSCYSVYKHINNLGGRRNRSIKAALMVHGFDIPLEEETKFNIAFQKSKEILEPVQIPLIKISTNWRKLARKFKISWEDSHSTAIISTLSLLQKKYSYGIISNSYPYNHLNWGSNPFTDPYLSSTNFIIDHDGAEVTRVNKVAAISNWEIVNKNLRVCWQGKTYDKNCGKCEKCIRTILTYRVLGKSLPDCFEDDINNEHILSLKINNNHTKEFFQSILNSAIKNGLENESWVRALKKRIKRYRNQKMFNGLVKNIYNPKKDH